MTPKDYFTQDTTTKDLINCSYPNCNCQMFCRAEMGIEKDL